VLRRSRATRLEAGIGEDGAHLRRESNFVDACKEGRMMRSEQRCVVFVSGGPSRDALLDSIRLGCASFIPRPGP